MNEHLYFIQDAAGVCLFKEDLEGKDGEKSILFCFLLFLSILFSFQHHCISVALSKPASKENK